jgi:hypothetical protein
MQAIEFCPVITIASCYDLHFRFAKQNNLCNPPDPSEICDPALAIQNLLFSFFRIFFIAVPDQQYRL